MERSLSDVQFDGDRLSFDDFRREQNQLFDEHNRTMESHGTSSVEYNLHRLYDENPGAFGHWRTSLDEDRQ